MLDLRNLNLSLLGASIQTDRPYTLPAGFNWVPPFSVTRSSSAFYASTHDYQSNMPQGVEKHVRLNVGSGSNTGDSFEDAFGTVPQALSAGADVIFVHPQEVGMPTYYSRLDGIRSFNRTTPYSIIGMGNTGDVINDLAFITNFTWTRESAPNAEVYRTTRSGVTVIHDIGFTSSTDFFNDGANGLSTFYTEVNSIAECQLLAGSWFQDGSLLYVHTLAGGEPTSDVRIRLADSTTRQTNDVDVYIKNICAIGRDPFRFLYGNAANTGKVTLDQTASYHCDFNPAYRFDNVAEVFLNKPISEFCTGDDAFNYHTFGANAPACRVLEENARSFQSGAVGATNNNGSSIHDGGSIIRLNSVHDGSHGPVIIDVNDSESLNLGVTARNNLTNTGNSSTDVNFFAGGTSTMFTQDCNSSGSAFDRAGDSAASIIELGGFTGDAQDEPGIVRGIFDGALNVLWVGQSLAEGLVTDFAGAGAAAFTTEAALHGFTSVNHINGAKDGAAVLLDAAGTAGAYLDNANGEGEVFNDVLLPAVATSGIAFEDIDVVFYWIGNTDQSALQSGNITEAEHKQGFKDLIDLVRARATNAIHIPIPNIGNNSSTQFVSWNAIKRAQYQVVVENSNILESCGMYDLSRQDSTHPNQLGYQEAGRRCARMTAHYLDVGAPVNPLGASITSAVFSPIDNNITITVEHDDGTDFTISDRDGHTFTQNGTLTNPGFAVRLNPTQFVLQGSLNLNSGDEILVNWQFGSSRNVSTGNQFIDNSVHDLPLRPYFDVIAVES